MSSMVNQWNKTAEEYAEKQMTNPFSNWEGASTKKHLKKGDEGYGK